jgi:flavin reductase (DIM6/NTAB) family NADH-FMN oxidoreductase RutF
MKDIGGIVGLYPTPDTVVGTVRNGRINWMNVAHVGIWGPERMLLSIGKPHYTAKALRVGAAVSVNLVDEAILERADYVGLVSGKDIDKSGVFPVFYGTLSDAPLIENAPVAMACVIEEIYETRTHLNCIVRPVDTYVREDVLSEDGKIDFARIHPILFEMQQTRYLRSGDAVGRCWDIGKTRKKQIQKGEKNNAGYYI